MNPVKNNKILKFTGRLEMNTKTLFRRLDNLAGRLVNQLSTNPCNLGTSSPMLHINTLCFILINITQIMVLSGTTGELLKLFTSLGTDTFNQLISNLIQALTDVYNSLDFNPLLSSISSFTKEGTNLVLQIKNLF